MSAHPTGYGRVRGHHTFYETRASEILPAFPNELALVVVTVVTRKVTQLCVWSCFRSTRPVPIIVFKLLS